MRFVHAFLFNIRIRIVFYISSSVYFSPLCLAEKWIGLSYKFSNCVFCFFFFLFFSLPHLKRQYLYSTKNIFYFFVSSFLNMFEHIAFTTNIFTNIIGIISAIKRVNSRGSFLNLILTFPPIFHSQLSHFISNHRRIKRN